MTQLMTIQDVTSRQANSARGPFTIYEVHMGGQPHRARKPVYDLALTLKGQQVMADTRSEEKGEWTNYFVDAITLPTGEQRQAEPVQQIVSFVPTEKDRMIWRQTASKVAADLLDPGESEQDFWANVEKLVWFYETGQHPFSEQQDDIDF